MCCSSLGVLRLVNFYIPDQVSQPVLKSILYKRLQFSLFWIMIKVSPVFFLKGRRDKGKVRWRCSVLLVLSAPHHWLVSSGGRALCWHHLASELFWKSARWIRVTFKRLHFILNIYDSFSLNVWPVCCFCLFYFFSFGFWYFIFILIWGSCWGVFFCWGAGLTFWQPSLLHRSAQFCDCFRKPIMHRTNAVVGVICYCRPMLCVTSYVLSLVRG